MTYETHLATDAAGLGGVLADCMAVSTSVHAVLSNTASAAQSHIVVCTKSRLAERTTPTALALTDFSKSVFAVSLGNLDLGFYGCSALVFFLFFTINMTPWTNFVVPDLWHWLEVHKWVAVTFEIFTTVLVAYLYREMGIDSPAKTDRVSYVACSSMAALRWSSSSSSPST